MPQDPKSTLEAWMSSTSFTVWYRAPLFIDSPQILTLTRTGHGAHGNIPNAIPVWASPDYALEAQRKHGASQHLRRRTSSPLHQQRPAIADVLLGHQRQPILQPIERKATVPSI